jgi:hypothetical protein
MPDYETYEARADADRALSIAATTSPFTITVRFKGGLNSKQQAAFTAAADRWVKVIVGDLPDVRVNGEVVDDVLIIAEGKPIDGTGKILGQAGPTHLRPDTGDRWSLLPARGIMSFDSADLAKMEQVGTLGDVITHEMGHVLGIGTLWTDKGLLAGAGTDNPTFTGSSARAEYGKLRDERGDDKVPVENEGGPGTAEGHWRESVFVNELMTGFVRTPGNPMSRLTVASLGDLGYEVDIDAAEVYALPTVIEREAEAPKIDAVVIRVTPVRLPNDSLDV